MKQRIRPMVLSAFLMAASLNAQQEATPDYTRAAASGGLNAFNKALDLTTLGALLEDRGSFTVFAPSNAAFSKMLAYTGQQPTDSEHMKILRDILAYHIVAGELTASRILKALCRGQGMATFTTILGEPLQATMEGTDIVLTDCLGNRARIVRADTARESLLFHEIDTVVLPSEARPWPAR